LRYNVEPCLLWGQGPVPPMGGLIKAAPFGCGYLLIGSGNIVHNLHAYAWGNQKTRPFDWAVRFEKHARELMLKGDDTPLIAYEKLGRDAMLSIPTPDHYLPLLYVLGLRKKSEQVTFPVQGVDGGSVSMLAIQIG
jgi:4,5-DOPA dioxygenase extradiol